MKDYNVYLNDGSYIEIEAEGWYFEGDLVVFVIVPEDEIIVDKAAFNLKNIAGFCEVNE